jgi:hypothetical protein
MYGALPPLLRTSSWHGAKLSPRTILMEDRIVADAGGRVIGAAG